MTDTTKRTRISSIWDSGARSRLTDEQLRERGRTRKSRLRAKVRDEMAVAKNTKNMK
jgi:hypothetical protein